MAESRQSHVIISPHFDDGVFSCGGMAHQLRRAGHSVIIVTMMGGVREGAAPDTPILRDLLRRWQAGGDPLRHRQREDERAAQALGVEYSHIPLTDCVYRAVDGMALYPSEASLFGEVHAADFAPRLLRGIGVPQISQSITVYLPLAVGNHVDHQIVLDWGLSQIAENPGRWAVRFYAEYPYSNADKSTEIALDALGMALRPADFALGEVDMRAKLAAIACYESQISTFWQDLRDMEADVRRAFTDPQTGAYVEGLWQPAS
ncbi:MAG: PIG-L family deacetylase [Chloroflexi bacterium]|nr:PIG-L family deacetylase [Chloroflexota bacterium]MCY4247140.1 PIG-L family deacetylase [Chloroflexota bacterium]